MSDQPPPLFRYVPLADCAPPPWPAAANVRRGWQAFRRLIRPPSALEPPAVDPRSLARLPESLLEGVACQQRIEALTAALNCVFAPWATDATGGGQARVVVSATHCASRAALLAWGREHGWTVIEPPTAEEILSGGETWLANLAKMGRADCVLPRLERCFLRHADGLDLCRRLLGWLLARKGRCLVGCNSWAWAFLDAALGVESVLPGPWTLAAFDRAALERWFQELLIACPGQPPVFRNAANGRLVLASPTAAGQPENTAKADKRDDFLVHLAAGSRGIAAVAWALWRHSLRVAGTAQTSAEARETAAADFGTTIWVKPWAELNLPAPSPRARQSHRFILHALLIHGGLSEAAVGLLVPISGAVLCQSLRVLEAEGLIHQEDGVWQVTNCAYPAVRQSLVNEEYLAGVL